MKKIELLLKGDLVAEELEIAEGRIFSLYDHVCNIGTAMGTGFSLIDSQVMMAPYHLRIKGLLLKELGLEIGLKVMISQESIIIPEKNLEFNLAGVTEWKSSLPDISLDSITRLRWEQLFTYVKDHGKQEGFAFFIKYLPQLLRSAQLNNDRPDTGLQDIKNEVLQLDPFKQKGFQLLQSLISCTDSEKFLKTVDQLIGLGQGQTPAGDDFLVGWLSFIILKGLPYKSILVDFLKKIDLFALTTFVSAMQLKAALKGGFNEKILLFYQNLESKEVDFFAVVDSLLGVGSTSGTDMLTGIMAGYLFENYNKYINFC